VGFFCVYLIPWDTKFISSRGVSSIFLNENLENLNISLLIKEFEFLEKLKSKVKLFPNYGDFIEKKKL